MSTPSTISLDTELSAVNSILGSIGQSPITTLDFTNPEISFIHNLLREVNVDVQSEGWSYTTRRQTTSSLLMSTASSKSRQTSFVTTFTTVKTSVPRMSWSETGDCTTKFNIQMYSPTDLYLDIVTLYEFNDLPFVFKRYITYRAAGRAAAQLIANPQSSPTPSHSRGTSQSCLH